MSDNATDEKRIILEMGTGNDLYGLDYTKAAIRAVHDALHHSSIVLFKSLGYDHHDMRVQVTIGVQHPDKVDCDAVAAELPSRVYQLADWYRQVASVVWCWGNRLQESQLDT